MSVRVSQGADPEGEGGGDDPSAPCGEQIGPGRSTESFCWGGHGEGGRVGGSVRGDFSQDESQRWQGTETTTRRCSSVLKTLSDQDSGPQRVHTGTCRLKQEFWIKIIFLQFLLLCLFMLMKCSRKASGYLQIPAEVSTCADTSVLCNLWMSLQLLPLSLSRVSQVFFDLMREVRKKKLSESKDKNGPSGKKKKKPCCIL